MAEGHLNTGPEGNKLQPPLSAEAITREEGEPSRSSQEDSYWGDPYTEVIMGLVQIKAIGDLLVSEITGGINAFQSLFPGASLYELDNETLPNLCHLIQEKATRIKYLVEKER